MRRINIQIRSKRTQEVVPGFLIMHELSTSILCFFSTKKFKHEEELEIFAEIHGSDKKYEVEMLQCHEQISSGRVMTMIPVEGQPLPTRTFYRCYSKIKSLVTLEETSDTTEAEHADAQTADVIPITAAASEAPETEEAAPVKEAA